MIELYRALIAEASPQGKRKRGTATRAAGCEIGRGRFASGSVSRLNAFVPEKDCADRAVSTVSSLRKRKLATKVEVKHEELSAHLDAN